MTNLELQGERLTVLPLRMETITIGGPAGTVDQVSKLHQHSANNGAGGDCKLSHCKQFNAQANAADINQKRMGGGATLEDVIEDNSKLFQSLPFSN